MTDQKIGIIVQARMGSTRLPGKAMLPLGDTTVIGMCLRRCAETGLPVVAAVPEERRTFHHNVDTCRQHWRVDNPDDAKLTAHIEELGFPVFRGSEENVLERYVKCAEKFGFTDVVRVTGDCPLIEPVLIKSMVEYYEDLYRTFPSHCHFFLTNCDRGEENPHPSGQDIEIAKTTYLDWHLKLTGAAREHVTALFKCANPRETRWVYDKTGRWRDKFKDMKTSVDTQADYDFVKRCLEDPSLYRNDVTSETPTT